MFYLCYLLLVTRKKQGFSKAVGAGLGLGKKHHIVHSYVIGYNIDCAQHESLYLEDGLLSKTEKKKRLL